MSSLFADAAGPKERPAEEDPRWQTTLPEGEREALAIAPAQPVAPAAAERHLQELFLTGPAAEALRVHYAGRREPPSDPHAIALFDPVRMWAPALLKSLADAGGQPIERLVLRDALALTTLATVERTRIVRPADETLKLQHADVPSGIADAAAVPLVLMERAQLAVVIVGPMHAESVAGMLERILAATHEPGWHCPNLLFMLPPAAVWIANKVVGMGWPQPLRVTVLNESLASTSAVWNAVLGIWTHAKTLPPWSPPPEERPLVEAFETIHVEPAEPRAERVEVIEHRRRRPLAERPLAHGRRQHPLDLFRIHPVSLPHRGFTTWSASGGILRRAGTARGSARRGIAG